MFPNLAHFLMYGRRMRLAPDILEDNSDSDDMSRELQDFSSSAEKGSILQSHQQINKEDLIRAVAKRS